MRATSAVKRPTSRADEIVRLRTFRPADLGALVAFWNRAFADRRNFLPMTPELYRRRVLDCPAFDPGGLFLAWRAVEGRAEELVGLAHAMKPAPQEGIYVRWGRQHSIALLYVDPAYRLRGIGSRLLQAAENWLYYCPVVVAGHAQPAYGAVEGPRPAFFGSTERMGIMADERDLLHFLARRGYAVENPGDVSMRLLTRGALLPAPAPIDLSAHGLALIEVSHEHPFTGREPPGRAEYTVWGKNQGDPYAGYIFVDRKQLLRGHLSWYPLAEPGCVALGNFWLAPALRRRGLGAYLLELSLHAMSHAATERIELHTHLTRFDRAVALYQSRGFEVDAAWVNLVKT